LSDSLDDLELLSRVSREAGLIALKYFNSPNEVWTKSGNSPVSQADYAVDAFLKEALMSARPDYGWLSEETEDDFKRLEKERLFVADPIDGTRGFLAGHKQWCISVAVVENNRAIAGVLECPALEEHYSGSSGAGSFLNGKRLELSKNNTVESITGSRKLNEALETYSGAKLNVLPFVPSLAYRLAMVANGTIDAALVRSGAHDWDIAAADIILGEAGGKITDKNGSLIQLNRQSSRTGALIASADSRHDTLMELAKSGGFLH
jgi:myo-inositol-1(or 4)-monophosphatase